jgi:hypothetical protein
MREKQSNTAQQRARADTGGGRFSLGSAESALRKKKNHWTHPKVLNQKFKCFFKNFAV